MKQAAFTCLLVWFACSNAYAQPTNGRRIYNEQLRVRLDETTTPSDRETGLDAGGWFNFTFFNYDDALGKKRTLRQYELRGWASLNVKNVHQAYFRGLWGYSDWNGGANPKSYVNDEDIDPMVERAWYQLDLGRLIQNQTAQRPAVGAKIKVGRAFAEIGTSLVLSIPLDMVQARVRAGDWELMALVGKALRNGTNIDASTPVATHQERWFWGFQLSYDGFDRHRPFAYFLANNDHTSPRPDRSPGLPNQDFDYTSRYVGIGSRGTVGLPNLRYQTELVGEWGDAYSEGAVSGRDDIGAMAFDVLVEYLFETEMHPKIMAEYLFASGDSDRRVSSSSTIGGNRRGTTDNAFNAFGFRDTGLSFAPLISNLHMYMAGASFFPLEKHKIFRKLEIGSKIFFYHKAVSGGPISDTTANTTSRWLGWEWDLYCDWRITSDLTWTTRYGAFQPGAAFQNQDCRQFFLTAVTLSF